MLLWGCFFPSSLFLLVHVLLSNTFPKPNRVVIPLAEQPVDVRFGGDTVMVGPPAVARRGQCNAVLVLAWTILIKVISIKTPGFKKTSEAVWLPLGPGGEIEGLVVAEAPLKLAWKWLTLEIFVPTPQVSERVSFFFPFLTHYAPLTPVGPT